MNLNYSSYEATNKHRIGKSDNVAELHSPKLSDSDDIESRGLWIPAFAGMTNKTQRVPVMPDLIRHPVNGDAGFLGQITQFRIQLI